MKKLIYGISFLFILILIGACFSPWRGEENGNLSIVWGNTENSPRLVHDLAEPTEYRVILKGPDGKQKEYDFDGVPGASFSVAPGTWNVTVKGGMKVTPPPGGGYYGFDLDIIGMSQIEVSAGEKTTEFIDMYNAVEVWNWEDLDFYIYNNYGNCSDCDIAQHEIIYILKSEDLLGEFEVSRTINIFNPVIIVADSDITLIRENSGRQFIEQFFQVSGNDARLTLGSPGMNGKITIDGYLSDLGSGLEPFPTKEAIFVENNSTLIMNEGVSIIENYTHYDDLWEYRYNGGGVYVNSATFTMNGGTISGNQAGYGGAVYVSGNYGFAKGVFNMAGGTISGNEALNGDGGGVGVDVGEFNMTGGTISGNIATNGGGVFVYSGNGYFTKTGNSVIYGSDASETLQNTAFNKFNNETGLGHAVYVYSSSSGENPERIRNTTAGASVDLDIGNNSGWEIN